MSRRKKIESYFTEIGNEESPYKPDSVVNHHPSSNVITDIVMRSTR